MAGSGTLDLRDAPAGVLAFGSAPVALDNGDDATSGTLDLRDAPGSGTLDFGASDAPPGGGEYALAADADIGAIDCGINLVWDANISRGPRAFARCGWQDGAAQRAAAAHRWQDSTAIFLCAASHWQDGTPNHGTASARWQDTLRLASPAVVRWQDGAVLRGAQALRWQDTTGRRAVLGAAWQEATAVRHADRVPYQEMQRLRHARAVRAQDGHAARRLLLEALFDATPARSLLRQHWQDARRPPPGLSWHDLPPEPPHLCYDPLKLGWLDFGRDDTAPGVLHFICRDSAPPPDATIVVERRRSYIVINAIEVRRVDTDQLLPALDQGLSMQLDRGSWTWGFTVTFHASALPLLQPAADGTPVALTLTVNGQPFRMVVESIARSVRFPSAQLTVRGRGRAALLDAPYAATRSFSHDVDRTAQQLMEDALTINGVSIGWSLDWQIDDWYIPAATWAHQGTWITAVTDIAATVGAYVQPHDTGEVLRILPAWPAPIWELAAATPDIELPPGIATVEETEWITRPDYDALYLHGEPGTSLYYRNRAGTAGDSLAPMAVHSLLVHADAARQRALAELSETGRQVEHQLQLMVLPETGIIKPGTLLRYTDDAAVTRTGITRAVSVAMSGPTLTQTVRVQAHA